MKELTIQEVKRIQNEFKDACVINKDQVVDKRFDVIMFDIVKSKDKGLEYLLLYCRSKELGDFKMFVRCGTVLYYDIIKYRQFLNNVSIKKIVETDKSYYVLN